ncbi:hypothetical protein UCRPA7_4254 [Phaeoacremonium minimum UCRPA7]|uniref:Uncharacterized protein n=1 Tax=Phaeoacremonium minimum (strain UCR-PA7) TaxID=1286976 RepID=R8BM16_PHAM7|nr:hypothetical protein UCRPA7_4254 [Phaeoacremonium minimum UCRPA7]EOO00320.1 hypothetical protein UCRPA7_4254 [Phaeoacremonium minimum UCRPA7]
MPVTSYDSASMGPKRAPQLVLQARPRRISLHNIFGDEVADRDLLKPLTDDAAPHHISISGISAFLVAIKRPLSLPGFDTLYELNDAVQSTLFRAPVASLISSADDKSSSTTTVVYDKIPAAIRILGANPGIQDESTSLWRHSSRAGSQNRRRSGDIGVEGAKTTTPPAPGAHISFWLLIANTNLHPSMTDIISKTTGTFYQSATTPYLSVNYCIREHCSHHTTDECSGVAGLARAGEAGLYNRYLLREEVAYVQEQFEIETADVVHFAVVLGWRSFTLWRFTPNSPTGIISRRSIEKALSQPSRKGSRREGFDFDRGAAAAHSDTAGRESTTRGTQEHDKRHDVKNKDETNTGKGDQKGGSLDAGTYSRADAGTASLVAKTANPMAMPATSQGMFSMGSRLRQKQVESEGKPRAEASDTAHRQERQQKYHDKRLHGLGWDGCTMSYLLGGRTTIRADVTELARFINAIHAWGEGRHAAGVVEDVVALYS